LVYYKLLIHASLNPLPDTHARDFSVCGVQKRELYMLKTEKKQKVIKKAQVNDKDTGSSSVQIAILTERIKELTGHLKKHKKDLHSRRGLIKMVANRRKHLKYLEKNDNKAYTKIVSDLKLKG
jgi:small subunit ribosomal protein S15